MSRQSLWLAVTAVVLLLAISPSTFAATFTWDGGAVTGVWQTGVDVNNWNPNGYAPGNGASPGDDFVFNVATQPSVTLQGGHNPNVRNLLINTATARTFTINGASANTRLEFVPTTSGDESLTVLQGSHVIASSNLGVDTGVVRIAGQNDQAWNIATGAQLTVSAVIQENGTRGFTKTGGGTLVLSNTGNTYSGTTRITSGILSISNNGNLGTGGVTLNGGTLRATGAFAWDTRPFVINAGTSTFEVASGITANGRTLFSGTGTLVKTGAGLLQFQSSGTGWAGPLQIDAGTVSLTSNRLTLNTAVTVNSGGQFRIHDDVGGAGGNFNLAAGATLTLNGNGPSSTGALAYIYATPVTNNPVQANFSNDVILGSDTTIAVNLPGDAAAMTLNLTGIFTGANNSLTKTGTGTLNIDANANLNNITITGGTLRSGLDAGSNFWNGGVTISGGGTLDLQDNGEGGTGNIVLIDGNIIGIAGTNINAPVFDLRNGSITLDLTDTGGAPVSPVNKTTGGTVVLSGAGSAYEGDTTITAGTLRMGAANVIPGGATFGDLIINGGTFDLNDNNQSINGLTGLAAGTIDNTAAGTATLTVGNNDSTSTFAGVIQDTDGNLSLTKVGTGTLTLTTSTNTYAGNTTLTAGTLSINDDLRLGSGAVIFNGGTLQTSGGSVDFGTKAFQVNSATSTIDVVSSTTTADSTWTGTGTLIKTGAGILEFGASGDGWDGDLTINAGVVSEASDRLGNVTSVLVNSGSQFRIRDNEDSASFNFGSGAIMTLHGDGPSGDGALKYTLQGGGSTSTPDASISNNVTLGSNSTIHVDNVDSSHTLTLTLNSFTGAAKNLTKIGDGTLVVDDDANIQNVIILGGTLRSKVIDGAGDNLYDGTVSVDGGGTFDLNGNIEDGGNVTLIDGIITGAAISGPIFDLQSGTIDAQITGTSVVNKTTSGTVIISNALNDYTGDTTISAGQLRIGAGGSLPNGAGKGDVIVNSPGLLNLNTHSETINGLSGTGTVNNGGAGGAATLSIGGNDDTTTFGGIFQSTGNRLNITKVGNGTLTLTNSGSSFGGMVDIQDGVLSISAIANQGTNSQLGTGFDTFGAPPAATVINLDNGATLRYTGTSASSNRLFDLDGAGGTIDVTVAGTTLTLDGNFNGDNVPFTKSGPGTLELPNNADLGNFTVSGGTLRSATGNGNFYRGSVTVSGGATLDLNGNPESGDGNVTLVSGTIAGGQIGVTSGFIFDLRSGTMSATMTTADAVNKTTGGTVLITANNTYTAPTTVSAGTLTLNGSIVNSSLTTVQSGATLNGTGTTGALTINAGGFHKPGNSPGTTTVSGNYTENGNLEIEFLDHTNPGGTGFDQVVVNSGGDVSIGASATLTTPFLGGAGTFNPSFGQQFVIISNTGLATTTTGAFSGLPAGTTIFVDTKPLKIYYDDGSNGNDVVLVSNYVGSAPSVSLYVDTSFTASATYDGDRETAGSQAVFGGLNAFASPTAAAAAFPSTAADVIVNGGTYATAYLAGNSSVVLRLVRDVNDSEPDITFQDLSGDANDSIQTRFYGVSDANLIVEQGSFAGTIFGVGNVSKTTAGTLTLSGNNTYSGTTTVASGVLAIQSNTALGGTLAGTTVQSGATLQLQGVSVAGESLSLDGAGFGGNGALRSTSSSSWNSLITLAGPAEIQSDAGTLTLSGGISAGANLLTFDGAGNTNVTTSGITGGGGSVAKYGSGTTTLSAANSYSGATTVNAGTLALTGSLQNASVAVNGGTFQHSAGTNNVTGGSGTGNLTLTGSGQYNLDGGTLDFHDYQAGGATTWTPGAGNESTITVPSAAQFSFTGGTLQDVSTITVGGGSGTFEQNGGNFVVGQNGTGPAALTTIDGGYSLLDGVLRLDIFGDDLTPEECCDNIASNNDQLTVEGAAYLDSTVSLNYAPGYEPEFGDVFTLLCADDIDYGSGFHVDGGFFRIVPSTGDPNGPMALQAIVPEPASVAVWTLVGLAGAAGAWRSRRRLACR